MLKHYYEQRDYGFLSARVCILCAYCVLITWFPGRDGTFVDEYGLGTRCTWCILCTLGSIWKVCTGVAKCIVLHCVQWLFLLFSGF